MYDKSVYVQHIEQLSDGEQEESGGEVCYYKVYFTRGAGPLENKQMISRDASLLENRVLALLSDQKQAVPPTLTSNLLSERSRYYQQYADSEIKGQGPFDPVTKAYAHALARIHYMNLGRHPEWLRSATENFEDRLWLRAWRKEWHLNLTIPKFALEYGCYTDRLDDSLSRLVAFLRERTMEGTSLTLIHTDLNPDRIRSMNGSPAFIYWEQAAYGCFYLDLPNYFSIETALCYRDALAELGLDIPPALFMEREREYVNLVDNLQFRSILLRLQERLSDNDRKRLHFFLGNDIPRRIRGDATLSGTLSLLESLLDQEKINEQDFTYLVKAFDEIQCIDAANLLR
ncbi:unnamed protein product, partial [Rotaria sordida]